MIILKLHHCVQFPTPRSFLAYGVISRRDSLVLLHAMRRDCDPKHAPLSKGLVATMSRNSTPSPDCLSSLFVWSKYSDLHG